MILAVDGYGPSSYSRTDYRAGGLMVFNVATGARTAVLRPLSRSNTRDVRQPDKIDKCQHVHR